MSQESCMSDTSGCENGFSDQQNNANGSKKFKIVHPRDGSDNYMHLDRRFAYIFDLAHNENSREDKSHLEILLRKKLCFHVVAEEANQTELIQTKIPNIVANSSHHEDSVLVCLLYNEPSSSDYKLVDIWKVFMNCEKLATKPKMFLFVEYNNKNRIDSDGPLREEKILHIPSHSDFILIHGFGNFYVKTLCEVVDEFAHVEDLVSMLTYTQARTLAKQGDSTSIKIPFFNNLLTHDVVFKLAEEDVTDYQENAEIYKSIVTERRRLMNESPSALAKRTLGDIESHWEKMEHDPMKGYVELAKKSIEAWLQHNPPTDASILREHVKVANSYLVKYFTR